MADYNDIPVGGNNNRTNNSANSFSDKQMYLEMIRRANAKAEAEKLRSQQMQSATQPRPQQPYGSQRQSQLSQQNSYGANIPVQQRPQQHYGTQQRVSQPQQVYGGQPVQRQQPYGAQNRQQMRPQQPYPQQNQTYQNQGVYIGQRVNQQYQQEPQYNAQQRQPSVNFNDLKDEFDNRRYGARQSSSQTTAYSNNPERIKPRKKRKIGKIIIRTILSLFLVAIVAFGGITAYIYSMFTNVDYKNTGKETTIEAISNMLSKDYVYNILLIGVDDRKEGQTSRSDTMILLSIDKQNKQLKMLSFMRDTYVSIPGHGNAKMNAACTYGGPQLVMETIEANFGIKVDNYMLVDFNAFKDIVDNLGGVTVEVEQREAEYINKTSRQKIDYGKEVKLNGEEALVYVRIRYLDSDFYRTKRQRKVISAIIESAKKTNPVDLIKTVEGIMPYIETDMSPAQLTILAESALFYIGYDMVQGRVPFDGAYSNKTINGQAVLYIDLEKTRELVHKFVYEKVEEETTTKK